jgi:Short C-terminal domain/Domain of unknwon function (DUF3824)
MMMRRRRPLARAAMVGGAAYAVGKHAQRGQEREAEQEARLQDLEAQQATGQAPRPQYAPPPPAAAPPAPMSAGGPTNLADELTKLKGLADAGVLTPEEFEAAKQKLLSG